MNISDIRAADARLAGRKRVTPLLSSPFLDEIAERPVLVKAECLQHTGSFKFRGAWSAISALPEGTGGVLAFSSGNHAQGVAMAARMRGLPAVIVMPADAPRLKLENTAALGAEVVTYDRETEDRDEIGSCLADMRGLSLVKPFDNPDVIAGQGTCGLEIAYQAKEAGVTEATVLTCCGGGGLTSGIALALEADAPGMKVRPVEPEGFDDVCRSLKAGEIRSNPTMAGSICDAIVTPRPGDLTFPIMHRLCGPGLAIPDEDARRAMALAFVRLKLVLEPGGAAALAAALFHGNDLNDGPVICTASGGNVDPGVFRAALDRYPEG
ncbi:L-threonine ammonia-lyase [Aliiruegeria haliotis]|uniref:L-threonine ammonia-lyase n=1 Tax=Aliiruegeria haliotis TaxID=1280846 RepID=A0A2T0RW99_9RHOB|nr:threonine/serine dehydratase [Aliiruegeria haliotis]PRY25430.1 L-threonine ammonia-lyase [Aliiruegeria haliotis]